ncbi:class C sortase [Lacticaseibacillus yichunensis]|uniref:Class C sortase n=1 Tax=Lacticaseibacillus yichunensis TaxID=2486015 RepID=A0ABW4CL35_9LACO|nr:class C sortase [Lacticaseibacillus yichunensis]
MAKKETQPPTKKRKKRLFSDILVIIIFFSGLAVFAYPFVANAVNNLVMSYRQKQDAAIIKENAKRQAAEREAQNKKIAEIGLRPNADIFKATGKVSGTAAYLQKHLIGAVTIPSIRINIPLYDDTNETTLQSGAAVLPGTSFPTGKKNTHTVISAHSALPGKQLFTDLEKVKKGEQFIITVDSKHMAYEVDTIEVVEPDDTSSLKLQAGRDIATLMTCTPYMINSHRLLVTGHRVPYTEELAADTKKADQHRNWLSIAIIALAVVGAGLAIWLIVRAVRKYKAKKAAAAGAGTEALAAKNVTESPASGATGDNVDGHAADSAGDQPDSHSPS